MLSHQGTTRFPLHEVPGEAGCLAREGMRGGVWGHLCWSHCGCSWHRGVGPGMLLCPPQGMTLLRMPTVLPSGTPDLVCPQFFPVVPTVWLLVQTNQLWPKLDGARCLVYTQLHRPLLPWAPGSALRRGGSHKSSGYEDMTVDHKYDAALSQQPHPWSVCLSIPASTRQALPQDLCYRHFSLS